MEKNTQQEKEISFSVMKCRMMLLEFSFVSNSQQQMDVYILFLLTNDFFPRSPGSKKKESLKNAGGINDSKPGDRPMLLQCLTREQSGFRSNKLFFGRDQSVICKCSLSLFRFRSLSVFLLLSFSRSLPLSPSIPCSLALPLLEIFTFYEASKEGQ